MQTPPIAFIEAAVFTVGCAAIYDLRAHAGRLTEVLSAIMVALTLVFMTMGSLTYAGAVSASFDLLSALERSP
ncbi:hypothetical protein [Methylobacterium nigriterrae]|uniref:hypothetical protein n=1 Tax=Methylobacterium nigriterrae TaxID=3127512 RepID=UPI0030136773